MQMEHLRRYGRITVEQSKTDRFPSVQPASANECPRHAFAATFSIQNA